MNNGVKYKSIFLWLIVFGIAMGLLEAIVVVYLRQIYYPAGFDFPLKFFEIKFFYVEVLRELSTILMLVSISVIAGKNFLQRFCFFLFSFAVWDVFYYAGLKLILGWPPSLLTWDILFLIPVTWVGPVLAPVISSLVFILFSVTIIILREKSIINNLSFFQWLSFLSGVLIVFLVYIWDYSKIIIGGGYINRLGELATDRKFIFEITSYVPVYFNWTLFILGEILMVLPLILIPVYGHYLYKNKKKNITNNTGNISGG